MKSRAPGKASKASLVARGLASKSKPPAVKRVQKGQKSAAKESKPGYSLYTSDSEDQASAVDRGLNRCAALLSNILDNEDKDSTSHSRVASVSKTAASSSKKVPAVQPIGRPGKFDRQTAKAASRKVVIPTASSEDKATPSPLHRHEEVTVRSTAYNDRLVSSTPVLTAEERHKRQQLQRREAELQQELAQLKERYELLQRQQSPSHQTEQKLQLQHSMMQQLENHQQYEDGSLQRDASQRSTGAQPEHISEREGNSNSNPRKTSARRSLDYSGFSVQKVQESDYNDSRSGGRMDLVGSEHNDESLKQGDQNSLQREIDTVPEPKKRVRIVSPSFTPSSYVDKELLSNTSQNLTKSLDDQAGLSEDSTTRHLTPPLSVSGKPSPGERMHSSSAENQARMIQYLVDELRALLGSTGDLEVNRLLNEIDDAAKLLPYLWEKDKTASAVQDFEQAVKPFKVENAQLRRRLLIAHQKLKEGSLKKQEDKSSAKTDLAFELAACRSVNTVLQKQLTEEKNNKEELLRLHDQLSQNLSELQEEKKKFLLILSNKERELLRLKRDWQQDASKLTVENKRMKSDLEAAHLSSEAEKKEVNILNLSLKQKDAEIERLKELTWGLQQSLTRLLSDIQQFQPKDIKSGSLDNPVSFEGLDNLLKRDVKTIGQPTTLGLSSAAAKSLITGNSNNTTSPRLFNRNNPQTIDRSDETLTRRTPNQRPVSQSKKRLRFVDRLMSQPDPSPAFTSRRLSRPLTDENEGAEYKITEESFANLDGMDSLEQGALEVENLEEELNSGDVSPLLSGEEEDFRRGLENLDANIARIQRSLRETALRT